MVLVVAEVEELKSFIVGSVQSTERLLRALDENIDAAGETQNGQNAITLERSLRKYVSDGVLTQAAKKELLKLVDYRNHIAHRIHFLTGDIGRTKISRDFVNYQPKWVPKYDYQARKRLRYFKDVIHRKASARYTMQVSFLPDLFEPMEKTLEDELDRLNQRILRQIEERKKQIEEINAELSLNGTGLTGELHPSHPANKYDSGKLTKRGVETCYRLFDHGKSPLSVAYLMELSLSSAINRRNLWKVAGGNKRQKIPLKKIFPGK